MTTKLRAVLGRDDLARIYVLQLGSDERFMVETVDSLDPRFPRSEKSVIIVSTQLGCVVGCPMCDAGGPYLGDLSAEQILEQVRVVLARRPEILATRKLKVHFARMGEPALNEGAVLSALTRLPEILPCPGLMPCISTVAPEGTAFFEGLCRTKRRLYKTGRFQLQLSINTTDPALRRRLIPVPHLGLKTLAEIGRGFFEPGDRKIALNFALARGVPVDPVILRKIFDPECFMIKLTPVNPTQAALRAGLVTILSAETPDAARDLVERLRRGGFDVVVSIGEAEEVRIGSNCGQIVRGMRAQMVEARA